MVKSLIASVALVAAASVSEVDAHTYVKSPQAEFKAGTKYPSEWVAEFGPPWSGTFRTGAQYDAERKKRGIKNLRAFLESKGPECGRTNPNAKRKPIPTDGLIKFGSSMEHPGPCEVWFDNTLVFSEVDCEKRFGSATQFNLNYSKCKGNCMLRFYWLGLQDGGKRWQSYKNCVPIGSATKSRSIDAEEDGYEYVPLNETKSEEYSFQDLN